MVLPEFIDDASHFIRSAYAASMKNDDRRSLAVDFIVQPGITGLYIMASSFIIPIRCAASHSVRFFREPAKRLCFLLLHDACRSICRQRCIGCLCIMDAISGQHACAKRAMQAISTDCVSSYTLL